jgi:hypothetical protein
MAPDRPFMELTSGEIWREIRAHGEALIEIRDGLNDLKESGKDRESRIRKLELRYYAILAGVVTGAIGYALSIARGIT